MSKISRKFAGKFPETFLTLGGRAESFRKLSGKSGKLPVKAPESGESDRKQAER